MALLVDTSAFYALIDESDAQHAPAARAFGGLVRQEPLVTHNYVVVEAASLVQRRLGSRFLRRLLTDVMPVVEVVIVDRPTHDAAMTALVAGGRRKVSPVDWVSFEVMRREGIEQAFAFDRDFAAQGFDTVP